MGMIVAEIKSRTKVHKEVMLLTCASAGDRPPSGMVSCDETCSGWFSLLHPDTCKSNPELILGNQEDSDFQVMEHEWWEV